jgi:hypothetical protein
MGSFVGRKRDGNTHWRVWSRFDKPPGNWQQRMTDFGGQ